MIAAPESGTRPHYLMSDITDRLLATLEKISQRLREYAPRAEQLARLPEPAARALTEHGLFRLWIPRTHEGFELPLPDALRIYEAAARIDGSIGWAVMIGSGGGLFAACLDVATADEIYRRPDAIIAGSGSPDGRAEEVPGGYRVSGRWRYASGAHYATTFTANCVLCRDGQVIRGADGMPRIRAMAFEPSQVSILSTWDSTGLRGTGSHDIEVDGAFVPARRSFSVLTDAPREPGPLYRLPFDVLTELPVTAVAVGIAAHALSSFSALARNKPAGESGKTVSDHPAVQTQYAASHASWRFVQTRLHQLATDAWRAACEGRALTSDERAEITSGCAHGLSELTDAIGKLARFAGMSAIARSDEFARAWCDLQALGAHVSVSPHQLTRAGATLISKPSF